MALSTDLRLNHARARGVKSDQPGYPASVTRARTVARIAPHTALARSAAALAIGAAAGLTLSLRYSSPVAVLGGWNAGGLTLLGLAWLIIATADAETTGRRAAADDPGRTAVTVLVLLASLAGFVAVTVLVRSPETIAPREEAELVVLCLLTVAVSWTLTHTAFTLRYAHLYYREEGGRGGGAEFPGGAQLSRFRIHGVHRRDVLPGLRHAGLEPAHPAHRPGAFSVVLPLQHSLPRVRAQPGRRDGGLRSILPRLPRPTAVVHGNQVPARREADPHALVQHHPGHARAAGAGDPSAHAAAGHAAGHAAPLPAGVARAGDVLGAVDPHPRRGARGVPAVAPHAAAPGAQAGRGAADAGAHLLQVRRSLARRIAQAEHGRAAGLLQQGRGHRAHRHRDRRGPVGLLDGDGLHHVRPEVHRLHGEGLVRAEAVPEEHDAALGRGGDRLAVGPHRIRALHPRQGRAHPGQPGHRHLRGGRRRRDARRHQVRARQRAEQRAPAPDDDRAGGQGADEARRRIPRRGDRLPRRRVELRRARLPVPRRQGGREGRPGRRGRAVQLPVAHQGRLRVRLRRH